MNRISDWVKATLDYSEDDDLSEAADMGAIYTDLQVYVPTIDAAEVTLQVASQSGYKDLYITDPADGGENEVLLSDGTGDLLWTIPSGPVESVKFATSNAQTADRDFYVRGFDKAY